MGNSNLNSNYLVASILGSAPGSECCLSDVNFEIMGISVSCLTGKGHYVRKSHHVKIEIFPSILSLCNMQRVFSMIAVLRSRLGGHNRDILWRSNQIGRSKCDLYFFLEDHGGTSRSIVRYPYFFLVRYRRSA